MMSRSAWDVVRMTTGICRSWSSPLISSNTSRPSFLGRFRSSRMRSGLATAACFPCRRRNARASTPSAATCRLLRTRASRNGSRVRRASPGLSSTNRISIGTALELISRLPDCGQRERERRAPARLGLDPDPAAVALHDLFADREPDARTRVLVLPVQPLENDEDALEVLGIDPDAVVADVKHPLAVVPLRRNPNLRRARPAELEGVREQIQEQVLQLPGISRDGRQAVARDRRSGFVDRELETLERAVERAVGVRRLD